MSVVSRCFPMSDPANAVQPAGARVVTGVREGDVLVGKYRIERILGEGGMGIVAQAHHLQLDERVAIKFLLPNALENPEVVARFAREARAAVKIKSEHVARVIDVGELDSGAPYMVMEFLKGQDLQVRLRADGALPIENAVEYILQACEAIAEAHALGIIHRDLKPANLFIIRRRDGTESTKVLDFGISKTTGMAGSGPDAAMTSTQSMMGSPLYMSPEQMISARDVDTRTDIWALGVILFELLCARPPFMAESFPQLCIEIAQRPPAALQPLRPDVPPALEAAILRCLEKDREKRYHSVAEMVAALSPFAPARAQASVQRVSRVLAAAGISSPDLNKALAGGRPAAPGGTDDAGLAVDQSHIRRGATVRATGGESTERVPRGSGISRALVGTVALAVVGAAAVAAWVWSRGEPEPDHATPPTPSVVEPAPVNSAAKKSIAVEPATAGDVSAHAVPSAEPPASAVAPPAVRPTPQPAPVTRPAPIPAARRAVRRSSRKDLYGDRK